MAAVIYLGAKSVPVVKYAQEKGWKFMCKPEIGEFIAAEEPGYSPIPSVARLETTEEPPSFTQYFEVIIPDSPPTEISVDSVKEVSQGDQSRKINPEDMDTNHALNDSLCSEEEEGTHQELAASPSSPSGTPNHGGAPLAEIVDNFQTVILPTLISPSAVQSPPLPTAQSPLPAAQSSPLPAVQQAVKVKPCFGKKKKAITAIQPDSAEKVPPTSTYVPVIVDARSLTANTNVNCNLGGKASNRKASGAITRAPAGKIPAVSVDASSESFNLPATSTTGNNSATASTKKAVNLTGKAIENTANVTSKVKVSAGTGKAKKNPVEASKAKKNLAEVSKPSTKGKGNSGKSGTNKATAWPSAAEMNKAEVGLAGRTTAEAVIDKVSKTLTSTAATSTAGLDLAKAANWLSKVTKMSTSVVNGTAERTTAGMVLDEVCDVVTIPSDVAGTGTSTAEPTGSTAPDTTTWMKETSAEANADNVTSTTPMDETSANTDCDGSNDDGTVSNAGNTSADTNTTGPGDAETSLSNAASNAGTTASNVEATASAEPNAEPNATAARSSMSSIPSLMIAAGLTGTDVTNFNSISPLMNAAGLTNMPNVRFIVPLMNVAGMGITQACTNMASAFTLVNSAGLRPVGKTRMDSPDNISSSMNGSIAETNLSWANDVLNKQRSAAPMKREPLPVPTRRVLSFQEEKVVKEELVLKRIKLKAEREAAREAAKSKKAEKRLAIKLCRLYLRVIKISMELDANSVRFGVLELDIDGHLRKVQYLRLNWAATPKPADPDLKGTQIGSVDIIAPDPNGLDGAVHVNCPLVQLEPSDELDSDTPQGMANTVCAGAGNGGTGAGYGVPKYSGPEYSGPGSSSQGASMTEGGAGSASKDAAYVGNPAGATSSNTGHAGLTSFQGWKRVIKRFRPSAKSGGDRATPEPKKKKRSTEGAVVSNSNPEMQVAEPRPAQRRSGPASTKSWIQCTLCKKWRKLPAETELSQFMYEQWFCNLSGDPEHNRCDMVEEDFALAADEEFVETAFVPGTIAWAKMRGYPWWPCMIEEDPDMGAYYIPAEEDGTIVPDKYHVVFFETPVNRVWVFKNDLKPYSVLNPNQGGYLATLAKKHHKSLQKSKEQAAEAMGLSLEGRLDKFSFSKRYLGGRKLSVECPTLSGLPTFSEPSTFSERQLQIKATLEQVAAVLSRKHPAPQVPEE